MECYPAWIVIAFSLSIPSQDMVDRDGQLIQMAEGIAVNVFGKLVAQLGDALLGGRIEGLVGIGTGAQLGGVEPEQGRGDLALLVILLMALKLAVKKAEG